jgi:hypothetical protein
MDLTKRKALLATIQQQTSTSRGQAVVTVDEGDWPFSESVFVVGDVSLDDLRAFAKPLMPSEVSIYQVRESYPRAPSLSGSVRLLWWD